MAWSNGAGVLVYCWPPGLEQVSFLATQAFLRFVSCGLNKIQGSAFAVKIPFTSGISTGTPPPAGKKVNPKASNSNTQAGHAKCQVKPPKPSITYVSIHTSQTGIQFEKISSPSCKHHCPLHVRPVGCGNNDFIALTLLQERMEDCSHLQILLVNQGPTCRWIPKKNTYPWCIFWEGKGHWLLELSCPSSRLSSIHDIGMCVFFKAKEPLPSRHCKQSCAQDQQLSCTPAKNSGNSTGDTTRLPHYQVLKTPFLMSWCSFGVKKMEKSNLKRRFSCHCIKEHKWKNQSTKGLIDKIEKIFTKSTNAAEFAHQRGLLSSLSQGLS